MKAPAYIDGALVLEWAWSEVPFGHVHSGAGAVATAIHGLALCQYPGSSVVYRFSCNAQWETEQDADYASIDEAKASLPEQYRQAPVSWSRA